MPDVYGRIQPKIQLVLNGNNAYIHCKSLTKPKWTFNKKPVIRGTMTEDDCKVQMIPAYEYHTGIYNCEGTYYNGKPFSIASELLVASKGAVESKLT